MMVIRSFEDLSLNEKIDIFIQQISGHEKEDEIYCLLALFTAYNINEEVLESYVAYTTKQIAEIINNKLINGGFDDEQEAWEVVINTLGTDNIWDIIDNANEYICRFNQLKNLLETLENVMMKMFTKI